MFDFNALFIILFDCRIQNATGYCDETSTTRSIFEIFPLNIEKLNFLDIYVRRKNTEYR